MRGEGKEEDMREWDGRDWGRTERESKERESYYGVREKPSNRNIFRESTSMTPAKTLNNSGEGT